MIPSPKWLLLLLKASKVVASFSKHDARSMLGHVGIRSRSALTHYDAALTRPRQRKIFWFSLCFLLFLFPRSSRGGFSLAAHISGGLEQETHPVLASKKMSTRAWRFLTHNSNKGFDMLRNPMNQAIGSRCMRFNNTQTYQSWAGKGGRRQFWKELSKPEGETYLPQSENWIQGLIFFPF